MTLNKMRLVSFFCDERMHADINGCAKRAKLTNAQFIRLSLQLTIESFAGDMEFASETIKSLMMDSRIRGKGMFGTKYSINNKRE